MRRLPRPQISRRVTQPDWRRYYNQLSTPENHEGIARRHFLQGLLATGTLAFAGANFAFGSEAARALGPDERILVIVLMGGGNDGYSMLTPANDGRYQAARGGLALSPSSGIPLNNDLFWNGNLPGIAGRFNAGEVAVVQGIGDPADDRSHFSSMARWMRGVTDPAPIGFTGWLGRWLDGAGLNGLGAISVGDGGVPLHMRGDRSRVTALSTYGNLYGASIEPWEVPAVNAFREMRDEGIGRPWMDTVATSMADALDAATIVAPVYKDNLPDNGIQRELAIAAEAINLDIGARIITTSFGDFDTHDDHRPRHQQLMTAFDQGVTGFFNRLRPDLADRVTLMTFSEFGRSWTRNDAAGLDHGTASNALVIGQSVQGGLYGEQPSFRQFDNEGDLEATVNFRSYYATILDDWLRADSGQILGGTYENLGFFDNTPAICEGVPATIIGTPGSDNIRGTSGRDVIVAKAGDDVILGLEGDDLICAGEGADVIWGGAGNDVIVAGGGNDLSGGGDGADWIDGGKGRDRLMGEGGDDYVQGGTGHDDIRGGPGNDELRGQGGDDLIRGDAGSDKVFGQGGDDTVWGHAGDDMLRGGADDDILYGQADSDLLFGNAGKDTLIGASGNDRLRGHARPDILEGGPGRDLLVGGGGADTHDGGPGNDRCVEGADQGLTEIWTECEAQP